MAHTITLIPGDGIGPEITKAAVRVLDATADRVLQAVFRVLEEGEVRTPDLGGGSSTEQFADAIVGGLAT